MYKLLTVLQLVGNHEVCILTNKDVHPTNIMGNRGAVMSVLPSAPVVTSTRASKHYGTDSLNPWDDERDAGQEKEWDEWDEMWRCNVMNWSIYKVGVYDISGVMKGLIGSCCGGYANAFTC